MMNANPLSGFLQIIVEHLDIPKSLYEKAADRHRSLGEWLKRESSTVRHLNPEIRPQGSFRFGTVNRPLFKDDEYDLDNICLLTALCKTDMTQQQLKQLYGDEIKAYAQKYGMLAPVREHHRCWRLRYADDVNFHLDTLPCVPEEAAVIDRLKQVSVAPDLARRAVAITDRRHPQYEQITSAWLSSNPRGFAAWFEQRAALGRTRALREGQIRATVEDVPPYEWKTPLQRSIQLLKRHRDVMFRDNRDCAPISMIITNLAARAYDGETDIGEALVHIIDRMPTFVRPEWPRVPNPADPAEDYADKWSKDSRLEKSFWDWYYTVKIDVNRLAGPLEKRELPDVSEKVFDVPLTKDEQRTLGIEEETSQRVTVKAAPALYIPAAAKPWGMHG
jgi:hypothetical protein